MIHDYLSTACYHAAEPGQEFRHAYCAAEAGLMGPKKPSECKWCTEKCRCECHRVPADPPGILFGYYEELPA